MSAAARTAGDALPAAVVEQAIRWMIDMEYGEADAAGRARFEAWLAADRAHAQAWARLQSIGAGVKRVSDGLAPAEARQALGRAAEGRRARRRVVGTGLAVGGLLWLGHDTEWARRVAADQAVVRGERRRLTLDDGSVLVMNGGTLLDLRFDETRRRVVLRQGEIMLESGPDAGAPRHRPLQVETPQGVLTAIGTRFAVRLDPDRTRLHVAEGAVALAPRADGRESAVARQGDTYWLTTDAVRRAAPLPEDPLGWLDGVIAARGMPLADFVAELARYHPRPLACDPAVGGLRVSGTFQTADPDHALALLAASMPVRVEPRRRWWRTVLVVAPAD